MRIRESLYFQALLCQRFFLFYKTLFLFISRISRHFLFCRTESIDTCEKAVLYLFEVFIADFK